MRDTTLVILIYAGLSLLLGGLAASYEIWHKPIMLDRADGRGKFPSPKSGAFEIVGICLFVAILWPVILMTAVIDGRSTKQ